MNPCAPERDPAFPSQRWRPDAGECGLTAPRPRAAVSTWPAKLFVITLLCAAIHARALPAADLPLSRTNLLLFHDANGAVRPVRDGVDWERRRAEILTNVVAVMGPLPGREKRCSLDVQVSSETDLGDYVRRFLSYAAEPGERVPAYLLIPKAALAGQLKAPGILALHQTHRAGQKVVVGLGDSPNDEYGVELAKRGYVVLAPPYPLLAEYAPDVKKLGYASGTMKAIWNNIRGLDLLASLPYVRTNGFGAIGHSLGGHNAVFTAVFDERLRVVVSSCGLDSFLDYQDANPANWQPERGWAQTRYMPRLAQYRGRLGELPFDFHELIGALAPRSCFISAPLGDTNFRWKSVDAIATAARPVYALLGVSENLRVEHPPCGHLFPVAMRARAYAEIDRVLK